MPPKLTTEEFIRKAKEVHDDKYTYDKVDYVSSRKKVIITCPKHGDFEQNPNSHLSGSGCSKCAGNQKLTKEEFISKAKKVHDDKYTYDKVDYVSSDKKVIITCIDPEHGDFEQTPNRHLSGNGCSKCGMISSSNKKKSTTEEFIRKAKEVHDDKYTYDKVDYVSSKTIVIITCPKHGDFEQKPDSHLSGFGCSKCGMISSSNKQKLTTEEFIRRAKEVHDDKYTYDKVDYVSSDKKVIITCIDPEHGDFEQAPHNHLWGQGCSKCAKSNYSKVSISFLETFPYRIIHAENEGEKIIETKKNKYKADGYFKASKSEEIDDIFRHCHHDCLFSRNPNSLEVVIEFHGCFWHGCEMCYTERDEINKKSGKTFEELHKATNRKKMSLIEVGYNYIEIWECQYKTLSEGLI